MAARKKSPKSHAKNRAPVTRERALAAAVSLADEEGVDALTMRRLAEQLGVEAMSLYHHVPNKDAILDGMVDLVFTEIDLPDAQLGWKLAMEWRAHATRSVLLRHRWALRLMETRTSPGHATLLHHDRVLGVLRTAGFSVRLSAHAYALLDSYVFGFVHTELNLPFQTTEEAHTLVSAMFAQIPEGAYPHLAELTVEHVLKPGYSYGNEFAFGLELILDGLERALAKERTLSRKPTNTRR